MKDTQSTEIVVDDKKFRRSQQERMLKSAEQMGSGLNEIGNYIKETKKYHKINLYIGVLIFGILLISIIGALVIVGKDDIKSMFVDMSKVRNIECINNNKKIILKSFEELYYYKQTFENSECDIK
jgi:hypothetical protein